MLQGGGSMAEPSAPAADSDAAAASGSAGGGRVATVVLRASTDNLLDDLERAIDDGVNNYKVFPDRVSGLAVYMQSLHDGDRRPAADGSADDASHVCS